MLKSRLPGNIIMKVAVFGSAFNPPTRGHQDAIENAMHARNGVDRILLVPSFKHAFGKFMADYEVRVAMLEAFVQDLADSRIELCTIEEVLYQEGKPVYTWDVLLHLEQSLPSNTQLSFVIGPDNAKNWHKFYKAAEIQQRWHLLEVPERKAIRSTLVRESLKHKQDVSALLTPSVETYIKAHKLYQE